MEIIKLRPVTKKCKRKAWRDTKQFNRLTKRTHQGGLSNKIKSEHERVWGKHGAHDK